MRDLQGLKIIEGVFESRIRVMKLGMRPNFLWKVFVLPFARPSFVHVSDCKERPLLVTLLNWATCGA